MVHFISIGFLLAVLTFDQGYAIYGGEEANITELPHQAFIKYQNLYRCGGSIISSRHILTIANCIEYPDYVVVVGTADIWNGGDVYKIEEITKHPDSATNLAVVKLAKEITFSDKAKPIALAGPKYNIKDGAELIASGWGPSPGNAPESDDLRKVTIAKVSDDVCRDADGNSDVNLSFHFCAGGKGKKAYAGDRGGSLIEKTSARNVLVGVISDGHSNISQDNQYSPSVFAKVSKVSEWIKEVADKDL